MSLLPEYITKNDDYSLTISLSRAYEIGGESRDKITLREPLAGDQRAFIPPNNASGKEIYDLTLKYVCHLAQDMVAPEDVNKLAARDAGRLTNALTFFAD